MPFLKINGATILVEKDSFSDVVRDPGGDAVVVMSGAVRKSRPALLKRDISFSTPPLLQSDAIVWELLIRGEGDQFQLLNRYSPKGALVSALNNGATVSSGLQLPASGGGSPAAATFDYLATYARVTVAAVRFINGVSDGLYIVRSDGAAWRAPSVGAPGVAVGLPSWISIGSSSVIVSGLAGASPANDTSFTSVWVFPELVPPSWPLGGMFGYASPRLFVEGNALTGLPATPPLTTTGSRTCLGAVEEVVAVRGNVGGVLYKNLRRLRVLLKEV